MKHEKNKREIFEALLRDSRKLNNKIHSRTFNMLNRFFGLTITQSQGLNTALDSFADYQLKPRTEAIELVSSHDEAQYQAKAAELLKALVKLLQKAPKENMLGTPYMVRDGILTILKRHTGAHYTPNPAAALSSAHFEHERTSLIKAAEAYIVELRGEDLNLGNALQQSPE